MATKVQGRTQRAHADRCVRQSRRDGDDENEIEKPT